MIRVSSEELIEFVRSKNGLQIPTQKRQLPFTVRLAGDGLVYVPLKTQKPRTHEFRWLERVCQRFSQTNSFHPSDYKNFTVNASYTLALIRAYLDSTGVVSQEWTAIPARIFDAANNEGAFDPENTKDARERILATIVRRRSQPEFRQKLMRLYGGKCILTGCDAEQALEAVHIQPYKGNHTNHPKNGLLMRADLHTLFDLHLIAVDTSNTSIILAPSLKTTSYGNLSGKQLNIPKDCPYPPSKAALDKHCKLSRLT